MSATRLSASAKRQVSGPLARPRPSRLRARTVRRARQVKNGETELHPLFTYYNDRLERSGPGVGEKYGEDVQRPPGPTVTPSYGAL